MENREPRSALFTVRDGEDALIRFTLTLLAILIGVFLHEILLEGRVWSAAFYKMLESKPHVLAWSTGLTLSQEGYVIMFSRLQDHRDRRNRRFAEARAEGRAEGRMEGQAEARAEGRMEGRMEGQAELSQLYQEIAEWNERRLAAEARNEPFTEPFPAPPEPPANA